MGGLKVVGVGLVVVVVGAEVAPVVGLVVGAVEGGLAADGAVVWLT